MISYNLSDIHAHAHTHTHIYIYTYILYIHIYIYYIFICVCGDYILLIQTFHHPTGHPTTKMKAPFLHPCHLSSGAKMDTLIGLHRLQWSKLKQARFHCGLGSNFFKKNPPDGETWLCRKLFARGVAQQKLIVPAWGHNKPLGLCTQLKHTKTTVSYSFLRQNRLNQRRLGPLGRGATCTSAARACDAIRPGSLIDSFAQLVQKHWIFKNQWTIFKIWTSYTSSTAQGGGGSFKIGKPIGEVGCCESRMAERSHWWTDRWLRSPLFLSFFLSFSAYLPTHLPIYLCIYLPIYLSVCLSLSIYLSICLSVCLFVCLSISLSLSLFLSIDLSIYLSNLSIYLIYLPTYLSIHPSIYFLPICPSTYPPIYLSIHPSMHPSIHLSDLSICPKAFSSADRNVISRPNDIGTATWRCAFVLSEKNTQLCL